jgi:hypothetical protein
MKNQNTLIISVLILFLATINLSAQDTQGKKWIIPVGAGFGKILTLGKQPININPQAFYNMIAPTGAGTWPLQLQVILLFPKKTK